MGESPDFKGGTVFPFRGIGSAKKGGVFEDSAGGGVDDGEGVLVGGDGVVGEAKGAGVVEGVLFGGNKRR